MSDDLGRLSAPQRQSRWAVGFLALTALRRIGIAQLLVMVVFLRGLPFVALAVLVPFAGLVLLAIGVLGWWRFTFMVADGELRVTKGILSDDRLTVPLDRVQSVSLHQGFLHRAIGLVGVSLDTAGASEAEFTIESVERPVAEALQRVTAEHRNLAAAAAADVDPAGPAVLPPPELTVVQRDVGRLVQSGLARPAFGGLALLFPLFAVADDLSGVLPVDLPEVDTDGVVGALVWLIPFAVVAAIVAGLALNLVQVILTQWNLALTFRDGGFRRTAGLISRTSRSTNVDRVQAVRWRRNPIERRLGIRRVQLPTIGEGDLHVPGTDDDELATMQRLVLDADSRVAEPDRRIAAAQILRDTRNTALLVAAVAVPAWFVVGPWAFLLAVLVIARFLATRRLVAKARWGLTAGGAARRDEVITESSMEILLRKVNGVEVRQSFFERSRALGTVRLRTADGTLSIGMIPLAEAEAVRDRVLYVVETDRGVWM
ncbi:MAG: PH domain-containing protein [Actinomycetota bacterium]